MSNQYTEELSRQLELLSQEYRENLKTKLGAIEIKWKRSKDGGHKGFSEVQELHRLIHNLSGSSATFGFDKIGTNCRELDEAFTSLLKQSGDYDIDKPDEVYIDNAIEGIRSLVMQSLTLPQGNMDMQSLHSNMRDGVYQVKILLLEDDEIYSKEISYHLKYFGYDVTICNDIEDAHKALSQESPDLMMFDIMLPGDNLGGINFLNDLKNKYTDDLPPCFFFSVREDLEARLAAVRAGAQGFFVKPLDYGEVVEQIVYRLKNISEDRYRIMIIDDDIDIAKHTSLVLEKAGAVTRVIVDTKELLHSLSEFKPELILMDLNMPRASGVELAMVIRQQNAYIGTIIVFHSTETQIHKHMQAMKSGGDDFLVKPIKDEDLINTLFMRLKRARVVNNLMIRDSLTNLINHFNIEDMLKRELSRSSRTGDVLTYAMIDIDHFKSVNDQYGHMVGDKVLVTLAGFLKQKFRSTDIIGRYGGEEFSVILPNTSLVKALDVFEHIRSEFAQIMHVGGNDRFSVTLSIGLASSPPYNKSDELQQAADNAMYASKSNGRNQTSLAPAHEITQDII